MDAFDHVDEMLDPEQKATVTVMIRAMMFDVDSHSEIADGPAPTPADDERIKDEFIGLNCRKVIDIQGFNKVVAKESTAPYLNVVLRYMLCPVKGIADVIQDTTYVIEYLQDLADKILTVFKTLGLITLTCTRLRCFYLNPLGGFLSGVVLSLIANPSVISYNIAPKIIS